MTAHRLRTGLMALVLAVLTVAPARADYVVTDLGDLPNGLKSQGNGVNASGGVVGTSTQPRNRSDGFRTGAGGQLIDLGTLGGVVTRGNAINQSGEVTGTSQVPGQGMHAFIGGPGGLTDLGTLGGSFSEGFAINNLGQVAGDSTTNGGQTHAFMTGLTGGMIDLGTLNGFDTSQARGINAFGQVAGTSSTAGVSHAMRVDGVGKLVDLGALAGGGNSSGQAINDFGVVVGSADDAGQFTHAALFDAAGFHDLGTLGGSTSIAQGINNLGQVVGQSLAAGQAFHAFLWDPAHGMRDLNAMIAPGSGWTLMDAAAISDTGYITGVGSINGQTHAFLLTPEAAAIPEPPALALLALGGLGLALGFGIRNGGFGQGMDAEGGDRASA
jgi:probable HAF family extracellular repeat protein